MDKAYGYGEWLKFVVKTSGLREGEGGPNKGRAAPMIYTKMIVYRLPLPDAWRNEDRPRTGLPGVYIPRVRQQV